MTLLIIIIIAILLYVIMAYNSMIKMRNEIKEAWADIDVQLKRRYNLIPNIVETVKGYASHEDTVLTKVTEARANAINAANLKDQGIAENMLAGALKSLFAVAENYPDLKANENFLQLQNELVDTEDKIQSARRFYNGTVRDFNTKIEQIPAKLVAQAFNFKSEEFFEIENGEERENVKVDFGKDEKVEEVKPVVSKTSTAPNVSIVPDVPVVVTSHGLSMDETAEKPPVAPDAVKPASDATPNADAPEKPADPGQTTMSL